MQTALLKTEIKHVIPASRGRPPIVRDVDVTQKGLVEVAKTEAAKAPAPLAKPALKRPNPIDVHVGAVIRRRRTMLGMSQERLGLALGITFQQVQKYEKGTNRVGASRLQNIAAALAVPVSFFFEGAPGGGDAPAANATAQENPLIAFLASDEGQVLNRAFVKITDAKVRRKVVELVKAMAAEADSE